MIIDMKLVVENIFDVHFSAIFIAYSNFLYGFVKSTGSFAAIYMYLPTVTYIEHMLILFKSLHQSLHKLRVFFLALLKTLNILLFFKNKVMSR